MVEEPNNPIERNLSPDSQDHYFSRKGVSNKINETINYK